MKNIYISILLILASLYVNGCSQKTVYETFRHSDKYNCESILNAQERTKCLEAKRPSYDEYQDYLKKTDENEL
jgi:hypothetical protein